METQKKETQNSIKGETAEAGASNEWYKLLTSCRKNDRNQNLDDGTTWNGFLKKVISPNTTKPEISGNIFIRSKKFIEMLRGPLGKIKWESIEDIDQETFEDIKKSLSESDLFNIYQFTTRMSDPFISFAGVEFDEFTVFNGCIFPVRVAFWGVIFRSEVHFRNCTFWKGANFDKAEFYGAADFSGISSLSFIGFSGAIFHKDCILSFASFYDSVIFSRVVFHDNLDLTRASFDGLPPDFSNTELPENIDWFMVQWPRKPKKDQFAGNQISRYQILYKRMNDMERHVDKQMFFDLEMKARRVNYFREKKFFVWLISFFYGMIAGYGSSVTKAIFWWASNIALGAYLVYPSAGANLQEGYKNLGNSIAVSFSNAHSFLGLNRGPLLSIYENYPKEKTIVNFDTIWIFQAILGPVLLFLVLLTIRNRFRLP